MRARLRLRRTFFLNGTTDHFAGGVLQPAIKRRTQFFSIENQRSVQYEPTAGFICLLFRLIRRRGKFSGRRSQRHDFRTDAFCRPNPLQQLFTQFVSRRRVCRVPHQIVKLIRVGTQVIEEIVGI